MGDDDQRGQGNAEIRQELAENLRRLQAHESRAVSCAFLAMLSLAVAVVVPADYRWAIAPAMFGLISLWSGWRAWQ